MNSILELKTVKDLQKMNFFIPSYQRGYRWTEKEVTELLNDISAFTPREIEGDDDNKHTWYCLQPIVVKSKKRSSDQHQYEVIDGQQRLTTIYLILYYLNQRTIEEYRERIFELKYGLPT